MNLSLNRIESNQETGIGEGADEDDDDGDDVEVGN